MKPDSGTVLLHSEAPTRSRRCRRGPGGRRNRQRGRGAEHALRAARDLMARTRLDGVRDWLECSFKVADEHGRIVMAGRFADTVARCTARRGRMTVASAIGRRAGAFPPVGDPTRRPR
ncbi:DUF6894 family protein [Methylobacterium terricola]|uniref:DUF6894 family protein n=1 Tax=Methylobacterium terricola TaxID=2583531 RepID=UPI003CCC5B2B